MNILITGAWGYDEKNIEKIKLLGNKIYFLQQEKDELPCKYEEIEGVICNNLFSIHPIEKFTHLKYIQLTSAGLDRIPIEYIQTKGIKLNNAKGVYSIPMAEFAILGVLQLYKQSYFFFENQKKGIWEKNRNLLELNKKTICIIGCGSVGTECAKKFSSFGCRIIGVDITGNISNSVHFSEVYSIKKLKNILKLADIVIITLPLTKETKGLFNKEIFSSMKNESILVNISRGAIVDEKSLIIALNSKLRGAVLDVFETEPLKKDNILWKLKNVIITPHNSFVGEFNNERLSNIIIQNLEEFYENFNNET